MSDRAPSWWDKLVDNPGFLGGVRRQWPWVLVLAFVALGLVLVLFRVWRWGAGLIGAAMVVAGLIRWLLKDPGILAIRGHRWIDLVIYFGLGVATMAMAVLVPSP